MNQFLYYSFIIILYILSAFSFAFLNFGVIFLNILVKTFNVSGFKDARVKPSGSRFTISLAKEGPDIQAILLVFNPHINMILLDGGVSNITNTFVNKKYEGKVTCGEVGIPIKENNLVLPCGIYGRWEKYE